MLTQSITSLFGDARLPARFWEKVNENGPIPTHRPDLGSCWLWTGGRSSKGYGTFWWQGHSSYAHRVAYELLVGPIGEGFESDHLCRVHACVNPLHVEPVTGSVNQLRGDHWERRRTHCPQGHPYSGENLYRDSNGWRYCKTCYKARARERRKAATQ